MSFMERLHSAMILKTPMYHPNEAHIVEQPYKTFLDAVRRGDKNAIESQILEGFDVDHADATHTPPLIYAIMHERTEIIYTLLSYGANVNIKNHKYETPLHTAVKMQLDEVLHLLMRYGARTDLLDQDGVSALDLAKACAYKEGIDILQKTPSMQHDDVPLFQASYRGDLLAIARSDQSNDRLFQLNEDEQTLLHPAVLSNNIKLVCYLLNKGLNIDAADKHGNTPLSLSVFFAGGEETVAYLIRRHATLDHQNNQRQSPLFTALQKGHLGYIHQLLEAGADINTTDGMHTPLTLCHDALEKYPEQADAFRKLESHLMIHGASVDVRINELGWTPLFYCVTHSQDEATKQQFELLLKLGANINHRDRNGRTPLMLACSTGRTQLLQRLLDNYANPDLIDQFGWSALMFAVYYNHVRMVRLLLEYGANVNASSDKGLTALKVATQYDRQLLVDLLIDYGAIVEDESRE